MPLEQRAKFVKGQKLASCKGETNQDARNNMVCLGHCSNTFDCFIVSFIHSGYSARIFLLKVNNQNNVKYVQSYQ